MQRFSRFHPAPRDGNFRPRFRLNLLLTAVLGFPAGAIAEGLSFSPAILDFGTHAIGESKKLGATLKNDTAADVVLTGARLAGASKPYSFTTTCGATLPAGQSCAYTVLFKSKALKPYPAGLEVTTGDPAFAVVKASLVGNPYPAFNDTGITGCGDAESNDLPCPVTGLLHQDAESGRDKTVARNGNGHAGFNFTKLDADGKALPAAAADWSCVRDNVTGLIWEKKPAGDGIIGNQGLHDADDNYTWYSTDSTGNGGVKGYAKQGKTCFGYRKTDGATWCNTEAYVQRVNAVGWCGAKNWRLPSIKELEGLVDLSIAYPGPAIDTVYFPDAVSALYWSSSPHAFTPDYSWFVGFTSGYTYYDSRDYGGAVRLVRGDQAAVRANVQTEPSCNPNIRAATPASRFVVDADKGTVLDKKGGLMWKRCVEGRSGAGCADGSHASYDWQGALSLAAASAHAGFGDWRLPNVKELRSIVEEKCHDPSVNLSVFPNTPPDWHWSSSPVASYPGFAWLVGFGFGDSYGDSLGNSGAVRLVRGGP